MKHIGRFLLALFACGMLFGLRSEFPTRAQENYQPCPSGKGSCYQSGYAGLSPDQEHGRDTWYFWTGGDLDATGKKVVGDQALWRILAVQSHGTFDLLQSIDSRYRPQRFKLFGVINDPDCKQAAGPDQYGLWIDDCSSPDIPKIAGIPGEPAGIIGVRKFRNPKFDPSQWDLTKYMSDPAKVEPPYLIGIACGLCHVGFNPLHPPADPENPEWRNLHPGIGNQYFREQVFNTAKFPPERGLKPNDFRWQVANAQPVGTSETSQVATDHINNPNVINNIAYVNFRPKHRERTADGVEREVYHVLKDGADSIGSACLDDPTPKPDIDDTACAALRVYVNIGVCASFWTTLHDPVYGLKRQQEPFDAKKARAADSACDEGWTGTEGRMNALEAFLRTLTPLHLADADGGGDYLPKDANVIARGKIVFAENCARCHSSKRPPQDYAGDINDWYRKAVMKDDFPTDNFLSDDERHPVSEIGTNSERALASNAIEGHIWQNFSSETYKRLPSVHVGDLVNPLNTDLKLLPFDATGGRGYYRTPTLANVWATAPFFHNNSLGIVTGDPSIRGRLTAYQDAMEKLLWPDRRLGSKTIRRTTQASTFKYEEGGTVCIAGKTPIDLIANVDVLTPDNFRTDNFFTRLMCHIFGTGHLNAMFLLVDQAPDFVQDRGHTFGEKLPDDDKKALIEYMKTF